MLPNRTRCHGCSGASRLTAGSAFCSAAIPDVDSLNRSPAWPPYSLDPAEACRVFKETARSLVIRPSLRSPKVRMLLRRRYSRHQTSQGRYCRVKIAWCQAGSGKCGACSRFTGHGAFVAQSISSWAKRDNAHILVVTYLETVAAFGTIGRPAMHESGGYLRKRSRSACLPLGDQLFGLRPVLVQGP